ncbi:hypothetical protein ACUXST_001631 [Sphingomonas sp. F9_3S_D5_B_2]
MKLRLIFLALSLAGCRDERPPAPTADESDQLNEMDESLNRLANNAEGPEANAAGPSRSSD